MTQLRTKKRRYGASAQLHACLLLSVLILAGLTGCASTDSSTRGAGGELGNGGGSSPQEHVDVAGVPSCAGLAHLQSDTPKPSGAGIDSLRLACLTKGPAVDLARLRGKPVLVNLWASWCGPCREEMPILQAASDHFGDRVQFVGVDTRDASSGAAEFLQDVGVTYPQLADPDAELLKQLRIPGLPVTLVLGPDGNVLDKHVGAFDENSLTDLLEKILAEDVPTSS